VFRAPRTDVGAELDEAPSGELIDIQLDMEKRSKKEPCEH
jgi:hypothetical protein